MKKQDIIDVINIEIEYCQDNMELNSDSYIAGKVSGLRKAKEVIERLDRGEMQFAKDTVTHGSTYYNTKENNHTNILENETPEYKCDKDDCHCHVGVGCKYFTRHCLCCRKK